MNNFSLIKKFLFAFAAILLIASCDDEFDQLNSDIIDGDIHTDQERFEGSVVAYDRATGGVQTSSATTNFLGIYDNPVLGKTTASYITQLELATTNLNTKFTDHMVVDSVWVYIPYYSDVISTETQGDSTVTKYNLNQVYGDSTAQFNLKIRKNDFYLRATDPASGGSTAQQYYSDQKALFEPYQVTNLRADSQPINGFSNEEKRRYARYLDEGVVTDVTAEVLQPGLLVYLDKQFFKDYIISDAGEPNLINNTVFKDYFRGISFATEQIGSTSAMAALNFAAGYVKIKYTQDDYDSSGNPVLGENNIVERESILMTLNMTGTHVNLFEFEPKPDYSSAITNSNTVNGDDRLYIKGGGEGSIALLDILKDEERATLRNMLVNETNPALNDTILINEANLIFYLDTVKMAGIKVKTDTKTVNLNDNPAPFRIYLYDVNNKRPLYDYSTDGTTSGDTRYNRYIYGGIPFKDSRGRTGYKIRLTNHISNLVKYADSTNVKLGLAVTNAIDVNSNARLHNPFPETWGANTLNVTTVPFANAMNPFGLVLYGPNIPVGDPNYDRRLRLEIYYTKKRE